MTDITKAQREVLELGFPIEFTPSSGRAVMHTPQGYSIRINTNTFNALVVRRLYERTRYLSEDGTLRYTTTKAGREAANV